MAQKVNEQCYEDMISALNTASKEILTAVQGMLAASATCAAALGEDDAGAGQLVTQLQSACQKYDSATDTAMAIAKAMQEELEASKQEDDVWNED